MLSIYWWKETCRLSSFTSLRVSVSTPNFPDAQRPCSKQPLEIFGELAVPIGQHLTYQNCSCTVIQMNDRPICQKEDHEASFITGKNHRKHSFEKIVYFVPIPQTRASGCPEQEEPYVIFCCCLVAKSYLTLLWPQGLQPVKAPLSTGFRRQKYWNGLPFPSPGDLPDPGIEPESSELVSKFCTTASSEKPM